MLHVDTILKHSLGPFPSHSALQRSFTTLSDENPILWESIKIAPLCRCWCDPRIICGWKMVEILSVDQASNIQAADWIKNSELLFDFVFLLFSSYN